MLRCRGAVTFIAWTPTTSYNMRKLLLFLAGPSVAMMKLKIGSPGFMPDQKAMGTRCLGGLLICWYQNFCSLPQYLGCLAQKRPFLPQNMHSWAHIGLAGSFGALLVGWLVVVVRGPRAVSRKTPIFLIVLIPESVNFLQKLRWGSRAFL